MNNKWWMFGLLFMAACSSDGGGDEANDFTIASTPLSGKIDGKAWSFVSGASDGFLSQGEPTLFTTLYADSVATCSGIPNSSHPEILIDLPRQPGTYALSTSRNATFAIPRSGSDTENLVATKGKLSISEVTAATVKGGAYIEYDPNNSVNGQFEAMVCPE